MIPGYRQAFFLHIPKTAGESLAHFLVHEADLGNVLRLPTDEGLVPALLKSRGYGAIHGHAPYPVIEALRQPVFTITILRSPIERVISQFEYVRRSDHPQHAQQRGRFRERGIETVEDLVEAGHAANSQTMMLAAELEIGPLLSAFELGELDAAEAREALMRSSYGHGDAAALERAKKRLDAFDFVGVTEGFDDSVRLLSRLIGLPGNPSAQRTNTAPESERAARADRYDAATLEAIAEANRLDLELYDHARSLFEERYRQAFEQAPSVRSPRLTVQPSVRRRPRSAAGEARPRRGLFIHLPGTDGQRLRRFLEDAEPHGVTTLPRDDRLFPTLAEAPASGFLEARAPYEVASLLPRPLFMITLVRAPVERTIAALEFAWQSDHPLQAERRRAWFDRGIATIADLIESGEFPANDQTRLLGLELDVKSLFERFETGELSAADAAAELQRAARRPATREDLERAKARLRSIQFVGIEGAAEPSLRLLARRLGARRPPPLKGHAGATAADPGRAGYSEEVLAAIAAANRLDDELYRFATRLFGRRYEAAFGESADFSEPAIPHRAGAGAGDHNGDGARQRRGRPGAGARRDGDGLGGYAKAFFLHIPKTAGMSFGTLLRQEVGARNVLRVGGEEEIFPALATAGDYTVVQGHLPYPVGAILGEPLLILTFLRDPLARVLSLFEYSRREADKPLFAKWKEGNVQSPLDLLELGFARNRQTKLLGAEFDLAPVLERYSSGELSARRALRQLQKLMRDPDRDALERAKERLDSIQFVGITEAFEASARLFARTVGMNAEPEVTRINAAPAGERTTRMQRYPSEALETIAELNALDIELHQYAVELFRTRYAAAFGTAPELELPPAAAQT